MIRHLKRCRNRVLDESIYWGVHYLHKEGINMDTAKIFTNGKNQVVRLPQKFRIDSDEVYVKKIGEVVYLIPKDAVHNIFVKSLSDFPDDFMKEDRDQGRFEIRMGI
jgi:antitoxin VapB